VRCSDVGVAADDAAQRSKPGFNYERCVRYNYDAEEKSMLVETIAMIKSLSSLLREVSRK
jgi:hypothetical protein